MPSLSGEGHLMHLGEADSQNHAEVMQASAAFVVVQGAFNWFTDN
jgi:hypothetical protein